MDIKGYSSAAAVATAMWPAVNAQPLQQDVTAVVKTPDVVVTAVNGSETTSNDQATNKDENKDQLSKKNVEEITDGLNDFMQSINTDLRFVLHRKTDQLMVQVVDTKTNKVLREAPPKELLDTLAKIRDLVGALLDKKA
ncbi:flagellar protein FlaG [Propionispora hippei]|uniref:Flagellar protein FlaG n=1 Tax=Propionispora hippei DSM 15287 TaxID=1123003 RepID=A0A1M6FG62_9FIRM|nr:flagellar protein FlaG [Propionispora hippei]SHI96700.1 flagellar protein FlaG [Propionispora hippei DSM 15287]